MKTIKTMNSTYEVDEEKKLVRRVSGTNTPCNYIGFDGSWQPYRGWQLVNGLAVFWGENPSKGFITSSIISIDED